MAYIVMADVLSIDVIRQPLLVRPEVTNETKRKKPKRRTKPNNDAQTFIFGKNSQIIFKSCHATNKFQFLLDFTTQKSQNLLTTQNHVAMFSGNFGFQHLLHTTPGILSILQQNRDEMVEHFVKWTNFFLMLSTNVGVLNFWIQL